MFKTLSIVFLFLFSNISLGFWQPLDERPLIKAALNADPETFRELLYNNAYDNVVNDTDASGCTALFMAVKHNRLDNALLLLEYGADIHITNNIGQNLFHAALLMPSGMFKYDLIRRNDAVRSFMNLFIQLGLSINDPDNAGQSPLHYAARQGEDKLIEYLLDNGAEINARDNRGRSPLSYASYREIAAKVFIDRGAKLDSVDDEGNTALHILEDGGWNRLCLVEFIGLLPNSYDFNVPNNQGYTVLHKILENYVARYRSSIDLLPMILKLLLEKGADFSLVFPNGDAPVDYFVASIRRSTEPNFEFNLPVAGGFISSLANNFFKPNQYETEGFSSAIKVLINGGALLNSNMLLETIDFLNQYEIAYKSSNKAAKK